MDLSEPLLLDRFISAVPSFDANAVPGIGMTSQGRTAVSGQAGAQE